MLNELTKKTLGKYIKKSSDDLQGHNQSVGYHFGKKDNNIESDEYDAIKSSEKAQKRIKGISMATNKLTKEYEEKYNNLLKSVINKEPVEFKKVFEDVMRMKATSYVALVKEEMAKSVFNVSEVYNENLDEDHDPEIEFHVMDKKAGYAVGKYSNIKRARNALDKKHNEYGGYSNHNISYYHKTKKEYVPLSQSFKKSEE